MREPKPGETWRSRDPRDGGLTVTILRVENGRVHIKRFNKTSLALNARFYREYEPAALAGKDTHPEQGRD